VTLAGADDQDRRSSGLLRIPFVRRCTLEFEGGRSLEAYLVNINILGAYVALDEMPPTGQNVTCRFQLPGNEREVRVGGVVAWANPHQQHPIHSLPKGFGIQFIRISREDLGRIEGVVEDYAARHRRSRR
jgi:Tfp pilus assembly protein PilZ